MMGVFYNKLKLTSSFQSSFFVLHLNQISFVSLKEDTVFSLRKIINKKPFCIYWCLLAEEYFSLK